MSMSQQPVEERDEIDRLFSRIVYTPPPQGLAGRVLAAIEARARRRQRMAFALLAASLLVTTMICFWLGAELARSGALGLIELLIMDAEDFAADPLGTLMAVAEAAPLAEAATVAGLLLLTAFVARVAVASSFHGRRTVER